MILFLDTGYFIALFNKRDQYHKRAIEISEDIKNSKWTRRIISDYILDELVTKLWYDTHNKNLILSVYDSLQNPNLVQIEKVSDVDLKHAWLEWIKYSEYPKRILSFTDCTILAQIKRLKINALITFDTQFIGLIDEIL